MKTKNSGGLFHEKVNDLRQVIEFSLVLKYFKRGLTIDTFLLTYFPAWALFSRRAGNVLVKISLFMKYILYKFYVLIGISLALLLLSFFILLKKKRN